MAERVLARIWIGGQLRKSQAHELVLAVCQSRVSTGKAGWEHVLCQPVSIEGIMEAVGGPLHLQDLTAPDGQMPILTETCRKVGLTYRLWHEPTDEAGARVEVWFPGLDQPLQFRGDHNDPHLELVETDPVRQAIEFLRRNEAVQARATLELACPDIPHIPPLQVIED